MACDHRELAGVFAVKIWFLGQLGRTFVGAVLTDESMVYDVFQINSCVLIRMVNLQWLV